MKRAILIHGWSGNPENCWFPWLSGELEKNGFKVERPAMPDSDNPKIGPWVEHLAKTVGAPDAETILIGHSIGCQTILRYLQTLKEGEEIGGVFLVASWLLIRGLGGDENNTAKPWVETPIDFEKIKSHSPYFVSIFSDNDQFVPLENVERHQKLLNAKTIVEKQKGHFDDEAGVKELPVLLSEILAHTK